MNSITPSHNFIAIDVEYADNEQHICQIGIAKVENLEIIGSHSWPIQPPCDYYDEGPMRIHHLTPEDTAHAADFELVWQEVQPILLMSELWAHNATSTEQPVLEKNLRMYGFNTDWLCVHDSRDLYQRPDCPANSGNSLPLCCKALGIEFDDTQHHDAEYDALKCAEIVIAHLKGQQPDWSGVPKSTEQLRKEQQEKRVLRLGEFAEYYAAHPSGEEDVFAVLSSTDGSGTEHVIDVYDKGDHFTDNAATEIDFARIATDNDYPIRDKSVTVTGVFRYKRDDIKKALKVMGIRPTDAISGKTAAVIVGTANVGPNKLVAIEEQEQKDHHIYRIVGDDDLDALLYGDGQKFFSE